MNFVVIGETVGKLDEKTLELTNSIPWKKIKSFRNIIAHDYMGVVPEEVWEIIKSDIPDLHEKLKNIL